MADIKLERKKGGLGWLWALLAILVLALILWWLWAAGRDGDELEPGVAEYGTELGTEPFGTGLATEPAAATAGEGRIAEILDNPQEWTDRDFPGGEVDVAEVPSDRGFWISQDGERLFAVVVDQPAERPVDVNPGQRLRIDGGTLRDAGHLPQLEGERPLDDTTRRAIEEQPIFLVVDEDDIEVLAAGEPQPGTEPALGVGGEPG